MHAVVLVSNLRQPSMRAIAYARATRPTTLDAVTVRVDPDATAELEREWAEADLPVALTILDSPYREITGPVVDYIAEIRRAGPRDLVVVFVPEYVVGHWWESVLHNQSALRLKLRLRLLSNVMVTSVPFQLASAAGDVAAVEGPRVAVGHG